MRVAALSLLVATVIGASFPVFASPAPAEQRAKIAELKRSIARLRPLIKSRWESVRLETLSTYPFDAPLFVTIGHQALRRLFTTLNSAASGNGTISVGAATLRYNWVLDTFQIKSVGESRLQLTSRYRIDLPGCCKCAGVLVQRIKWESRLLVPGQLLAECRTPRGEFSVQINPDELAVPLPFTLSTSVTFAPALRAGITGSLYFSVNDAGIVLKGDHLRVRP